MAAPTSDIDFYTIENQRLVSIETAPSEAAGFPFQNTMDKNLNTYWKPTSTATTAAVIDFGEVVSLNGLALFFRNYMDNLADGSTDVDLEYSDVGTSGPWTLFKRMNVNVDWELGKPISISVSAAAGSHRYWRIEFAGFLVVPEISHIFLYRKRGVDAQVIYPITDDPEFGGKIGKAHGGRIHTAPHSKTPVYIRKRTWNIVGDTDKDELLTLVEDCGGRTEILILHETDFDPEVVEIIDKRFIPNAIRHQIYQPNLTFRKIPFIEDSEHL